MKRYLLFLYYGTDIQGGWNDYQESFDTPEQAMNHFADYVAGDIYYYGHIVDMETGKIVFYNDGHEEWDVYPS